MYIISDDIFKSSFHCLLVHDKSTGIMALVD